MFSVLENPLFLRDGSIDMTFFVIQVVKIIGGVVATLQIITTPCMKTFY